MEKDELKDGATDEGNKERLLIYVLRHIGGFLIVLYAPLLIGLIWGNTDTFLRWCLTNTVLLLLVWLIVRSHEWANRSQP